MLDQGLKQIKEMFKTVIADDELFALGAQSMKKTFDALVNEGFTEDQAVKIVAGQGGIKING